ncbi:MAG: ATP-grasp fold amidoligase family protein, partial [Aeromicrobium sp.]
GRHQEPNWLNRSRSLPFAAVPRRLDDRDQDRRDRTAKHRQTAANIPAAYMRVDLYDIDSTVVFGEFTPRPGGSQFYGVPQDEHLGHLWERAHARVLKDAMDGKEFGLRYGPGPRELLIGDKVYLP